MNSYLIFTIHFIEFIDAADTVISKHESTCLNTEISSFRIFDYTSSKTCSTWCLSTCIDSSWQELADVLEELRLSCSRITNDANINVTSQLDTFFGFFGDSSKKLEHDTFLDIQMTVYWRSDGVGEFGIKIILILHSHDFVTLMKCEVLFPVFFRVFLIFIGTLVNTESCVTTLDWTSNEHKFVAEVFNSNLFETLNSVHGLSGVVSPHVGRIRVLGGVLFSRFQKLNDVWNNNELTCEYSLISGFWKIDNFTTKNNIDGSWHRSCWNVARELLHSDLLPINHGTVLIDKIPSHFILTLLVRASYRFSVFELLLDILDEGTTLQALECT